MILDLMLWKYVSWLVFERFVRAARCVFICQIIQSIDEPLCRHLMQPDHCPDVWFALMLKCWLIEPIDRPKFIDLLSLLQQVCPVHKFSHKIICIIFSKAVLFSFITFVFWFLQRSLFIKIVSWTMLVGI